MADGFHPIFKIDDIGSRIQRNENDDPEYKSEFLQVFFPWFSMRPTGAVVDFGPQPFSFIIIRKNLQSQKIFKPGVHN
jgi:hypothetical protein